LVIQEAAAFDKPSIVVKGSSSAEGIVDGVNGFLVDNDVHDLTKTINLLIKDPHAIQKAGSGARKSIYHPWETIVDDVYEKYIEVIKEYRQKQSGRLA
jgi:glycosyltransferase involved in cell wall biosynthesis